MHPQSWPQAHSRGLVDAATEARIDELLARMSLEEKVGQIIQTDIGAIVPEDLATLSARLDSRGRRIGTERR